MNHVKNIFGCGDIYDIGDLDGNIYTVCTACMSVWSEFLSWGNANISRISKEASLADNIVLLSCQVTDLAVINDLHTLEELMQVNTNAIFWVSGCLAYRFDIILPKQVRRLSHTRKDYQIIKDSTFVDYRKPFWINGDHDEDGTIKPGMLFRGYYPLRIGAGCACGCKCCTINVTRCNQYELNNLNELENELTYAYDLLEKDIVLISDSPSVDQIKQWVKISRCTGVPIALRNISPAVVMECKNELIGLAKAGLLTCLHSPIQSTSERILEHMGILAKVTLDFIKLVPVFIDLATVMATSIIIDFKPKRFPETEKDLEKATKIFDYVLWNPYWNGKWDRAKAEDRWENYFGKPPRGAKKK